MNRPRRKKDTPTKSNRRLDRYPPIKLTALPKQEERIRMIKKKRTIPTMKIHLTKKQRRYAWYPTGGGIFEITHKGDGPNNKKQYKFKKKH